MYDPRDRQEHIMRWLAFAVVLVLVVGALVDNLMRGPSGSAPAFWALAIALFGWLLRRLFES